MTGDLHFRDIHGYRRAFRMLGEGPPLLLIHGIADSSETWLPVLSELAEHHTVIAPDLLGHGESAKPRADYAVAAYACGMRDLLAVLGVDRVSVIGHSLGGGVAMQFAYQFPERCERIALVSSAGIGSEMHAMFRLATLPGAGPTMRMLSVPPLRAAVLTVAPLLRLIGGVGFSPDLDYALGRYVELADPTARKAFLRTVRAAADPWGQAITMLDRSYLARHLPLQIIWGGRDPIIPVEHAQIAQQALPGSRLEIFEKAGHFPHHHDPARFVKTVIDFLRETEPSEFDRREWQAVLREGRPGQPSTSSGA